MVQTVVNELASSDSEAGQTAFHTLLKNDGNLISVAAVSVENQGMAAILEVLEMGSLSITDVAQDHHEILKHLATIREQSPCSRWCLVGLLKVEQLIVLCQMDAISASLHVSDALAQAFDIRFFTFREYKLCILPQGYFNLYTSSCEELHNNQYSYKQIAQIHSLIFFFFFFKIIN